ncbi:MAG: SWIM zinc finger family protein [Clostridia bacterium]|nr:SWIM zinc finger family protein [Clostridia bacterium]
MGYDDYFSQPSKYELERKSAASRMQAEKSGKTMEPVIIEGRKITKTWWGNAWCENLERYADYENRIARGRSYVRSGTVIDLKIDKGRVEAKVQGSRRTPYKVLIMIDPLSDEKTNAIIEKCGKKIQTMEGLLKGDIPPEMQDVILGRDGLFPSPKEIKFNCSCPDIAYMCKHVAAVLYGIGARFDEDPMLFFILRGVDPSSFIEKAAKSKVDDMLANESNPSPRIIDDDDAWKIFGLE